LVVDYNSWQESEKGLALAAGLPKDTVLAEGMLKSWNYFWESGLIKIFIGYKEFDTGRTYMAKMGDRREDKDEEIELDGIGGVSILVKADVHRSGY